MGREDKVEKEDILMFIISYKNYLKYFGSII